MRLPPATPTPPTAAPVKGAKGVAFSRPSTRDEGMKSAPFARACAGVANHPIRMTDEPAVRFQSVVMPTGVKTFAFELSVMLGSVATEVVGVTVSVACFVAVRAMVGILELVPT